MNESPTPTALRLWPGVAAVIVLLVARFIVPIVWPDATPLGVIGGLLGGLVVGLWWVFWSRAPRSERWGAALVSVVAFVGTSMLVHESVGTGMMGLMLAVYAIPVLSLAFVVWAVTCRHLASGPRRGTMIATIVLACGAWTLVRTGGFSSELDQDFAWRWAATPEEQLLARGGEELVELSSDSVAMETVPEWPGFRGAVRDSVVQGMRIGTDWSAAPPVELWRRPVGPGWSSFAVHGNLFYTQEQRGEDEVVACYRVDTGEPVWRHRDAVRFWESNAGAGPRGTPTLAGGRVYTFGATGVLNALDAGHGDTVWSRDVAADAEVEVPEWGFASSPLVLDDLVIVAAAGKLVALDLASGEPRWFGPDGEGGYSSPHLLTIDGVRQVVLMSKAGAISVAPLDGSLLWEYAWPKTDRIVQPLLTEDGDILMSASERAGMRRITIAYGPEGWNLEERWTSRRFKPYFSDAVIHRGHVFGFDGSILACIDVEDGERQWKGGRYGSGQLVLLADQDLLLVLSESGELVLVEASTEEFTELARFPAIEGKTWNHPVLVDGILFVRNSEEMAAFRLSTIDPN